jgi:hypothetical protein
MNKNDWRLLRDIGLSDEEIEALIDRLAEQDAKNLTPIREEDKTPEDRSFEERLLRKLREKLGQKP